MEFFDTIRQIQTNWEPYKKWEFEQQKKEKQNDELRKKYPPTKDELLRAKQYGRTLIESINTMDQHSIDKSEDARVAIGYSLMPLEMGIMGVGFLLGRGMGSAVNKSSYAKKLENIKPYWELIGLIVVQAFAMPIVNIWQSSIMKQASRVARFQTRENDLKDSRNFVVYDQSQIEKAQEIAKGLPEIKEKRQDKFTGDTFNPIESYKKTKKTTDELKKDEENYQVWKQAYLKAEEEKKKSFEKINPSKEEISQAQKDRDALLGTIKKVETNSLNYLNNMEMAAYVINSAVSMTSIGLAFGLTQLIGFIQHHNKKLQDNKVIEHIKILPIVLSVVGNIMLMGPINKLIKDAARIGRFKAKQELLNNPENFVMYDDEQRKNVQISEKAESKPKGLIKRFIEDILALKQLQKDAKEYEEYMNTTHKEDLKLNEALKKLQISKDQEKEAKKLQKNAFHSFEKMDEKAQRFTDDTDAAVDSVRIVAASAIGLVVRLLSIFVCGKEIKRINNDKVPETFDKAMKLIFSGKLRGIAILGVLLPFVIPPFLKVPMVAKGVQIKKDAGKIGVMTAMQELDDPKNFL